MSRKLLLFSLAVAVLALPHELVAVIDPTAAPTASLTATASATPSISPSPTASPSPTPVPLVSLALATDNGNEVNEPTASFTINLSTASASTITAPFTISGTASRYGMNYISNSSAEVNLQNWVLYKGGSSDLAIDRVSSDSFVGKYSVKLTASNVGSYSIATYYIFDDIQPLGGLNTERNYTFSFYARATASSPIDIYINNWPSSGGDMVDFGTVTIGTAWKRYSFTFEPSITGLDPNYTPLHFEIPSGSVPLELYLDGLKLEQASSASKYGDYEFFGKNVISNSDLETNGTNWFINDGGSTGAFSQSTDYAYSGTHSAKFTATSFTDHLIPSYRLYSDIHPGGLSMSEQYALTFYGKAVTAKSFTGFISTGNTYNRITDIWNNIGFTSSWKRYEIIFAPRADGAPTTYYPNIELAASNDGVNLALSLDKLQLQKTAPISSVTFAPSETSKTIEMQVIDDKIFEGASGETIVVTLGTPSGGGAVLDTSSLSQYSRTFTINEDETKPVISLSNLPLSIPESDGGDPVSQAVNFVPDKVREIAITVPYTLSGTGTATEGTDYETLSHSLTINPYDNEGVVTLETIDDSTDEPDETVIFTVGTGSTTSGPDASSDEDRTLTIQDDDVPRVNLTESPTVREDIGDVEMTAELSSEYTDTVTVRYSTEDVSANAGLDYSETSGTLTFTPGQTSQSFNIPILKDCENEPNENFTVSLDDPVNATLGVSASQEVTIEEPRASFQIVPNLGINPFALFTFHNPECDDDIRLEFEYRLGGSGSWTDVALMNDNYWVDENGCGSEGFFFSTEGMEDTDIIEFLLDVTDLETDEHWTVTPCDEDLGPLYVSDIRWGKNERIVKALPLCPTPTPQTEAPTFAAEPTPYSGIPAAGNYMRSKYFSVGSGYQLSQAEMTTPVSTSAPKPLLTDISNDRLDVAGSVLTSQAVYGSNSGLWATGSSSTFEASPVRMLGGFISVVWGMREIGRQISRIDPSVAKGNVGNKYLLTTQTIASVLRGGSFYDSIRVVSRHNIGAAALATPSADPVKIHTIQGAEVVTYPTKPDLSGDPRVFPLGPKDNPEMMSGYALGTVYQAFANVDNKKQDGLNVMPARSSDGTEKNGGFIWRGVGFENVISSSDSGDAASFHVDQAAGISLRSTFGEQGSFAPYLPKYAAYVGLLMDTPQYGSDITTRVLNGLLIESQSRSAGASGSAKRESYLADSNSTKANLPERSANILTEESSVLGDGKSNGQRFSSDVVSIEGPLAFAPVASKPTLSTNLPKADRIGLICYDTSTNSLRVSVAGSSVDGSYGWARLSLVSPTTTPVPTATPPVKLSFVSQEDAGTTITVTIKIEGLPSGTATPQIKWRLRAYGKSYIGESGWSNLVTLTDWNSTTHLGKFVITPAAFDNSNLKKGQIVDILYFTTDMIGQASVVSDSFRIE